MQSDKLCVCAEDSYVKNDETVWVLKHGQPEDAVGVYKLISRDGRGGHPFAMNDAALEKLIKNAEDSNGAETLRTAAINTIAIFSDGWLNSESGKTSALNAAGKISAEEIDNAGGETLFKLRFDSCSPDWIEYGDDDRDYQDELYVSEPFKRYGRWYMFMIIRTESNPFESLALRLATGAIYMTSKTDFGGVGKRLERLRVWFSVTLCFFESLRFHTQNIDEIPLVGLRSDEVRNKKGGLKELKELKETKELLKDVFDFREFRLFRNQLEDGSIWSDINSHTFAKVVGNLMKFAQDDKYVTKQVYLRDLSDILNSTIPALNSVDKWNSWDSWDLESWDQVARSICAPMTNDILGDLSFRDAIDKELTGKSNVSAIMEKYSGQGIAQLKQRISMLWPVVEKECIRVFAGRWNDSRIDTQSRQLDAERAAKESSKEQIQQIQQRALRMLAIGIAAVLVVAIVVLVGCLLRRRNAISTKNLTSDCPPGDDGKGNEMPKRRATRGEGKSQVRLSDASDEAMYDAVETMS